jgi:hypothetical protein
MLQSKSRVRCGGKTGEGLFIQSSQPVQPGIRIRGPKSDSGHCLSARMVPRAPTASRRHADPWIAPESIWRNTLLLPRATSRQLSKPYWLCAQVDLRERCEWLAVLVGRESSDANLMGHGGPRQRLRAGTQYRDGTQVRVESAGPPGSADRQERRMSGP